MRGSGFLLLVVGLILLWLAVTGRLGNAAAAWGALKGTGAGGPEKHTGTSLVPGVPGGTLSAAEAAPRLPGTATTPNGYAAWLGAFGG